MDRQGQEGSQLSSGVEHEVSRPVPAERASNPRWGSLMTARTKTGLSALVLASALVSSGCGTVTGAVAGAIYDITRLDDE